MFTAGRTPKMVAGGGVLGATSSCRSLLIFLTHVRVVSLIEPSVWLQPALVVEVLADELADAAGVDPIDFRVRNAVGRVGEPYDIAQAYLFLMQERFSTGQTVVVDGGTVLV